MAQGTAWRGRVCFVIGFYGVIIFETFQAVDVAVEFEGLG